MIQKLNLPIAKIKLTKDSKGQLFVWCIIRNKKLVLTPEEWVRQHIIHFLINQKNVPKSLIASEALIKVNELNRRCDIVVFSLTKHPVLVVECKAPEIELSEKVVSQIAQYNSVLQSPYLLISNGLNHFTIKVDHSENNIKLLNELPTFDELSLSI
ncbi:MAG: type I restriction enzyme HsdR N-terminal domain-containing protein [Crocinitomicaceae bacterium]